MADEEEKKTPALEDLKTMIGLLPSNTSFDETLGLIISNTNLQLKFKLVSNDNDGDDFPA